jgi:hypothetical protein
VSSDSELSLDELFSVLIGTWPNGWVTPVDPVLENRYPFSVVLYVNMLFLIVTTLLSIILTKSKQR